MRSPPAPSSEALLQGSVSGSSLIPRGYNGLQLEWSGETSRKSETLNWVPRERQGEGIRREGSRELAPAKAHRLRDAGP